MLKIFTKGCDSVARYGDINDYRLTEQQLAIVNANRKAMGLSPLGEECLKSTTRLGEYKETLSSKR